MTSPDAPWLFFMFQLPARKASERVQVWRKLQKYGTLAWKNSAYILPHTPANLEKLQWLAAEIRKYHGDASIAEVRRIAGYSDKQVIALFNTARKRDYVRLIRELRRALRTPAPAGQDHRPNLMARLNRRLSEIAALDLFGCPERKKVEALIKDLEARARAGPSASRVGQEKSAKYRGRVWMTRPRPEVDRVASAWLVKNFVDPRARFIFSSDARSHPEAIRFDMFEGEFTHVGDDCTMETLLKRFALEDRRLRAIAQLVHDADLEDNKFGRPEGRALETVFKGWGKMGWADAEILRRGFELFDALYAALGG